MVFGLIYTFLALRRKGTHIHIPGMRNSHTSRSNMKDLKEKPAVSVGMWIAAIVGIAPCVTLIPIMFSAIPFGMQTTLMVMLVYAVSTIGMMVILTSIALKAIQFITKLKRIEKHLELFVGAVIFLAGLYILVEDVLFTFLRIVP